MRTFAPQGLTPQIVISYPISSHLHHICASSYLRFLSQIFTSSLSSSGLHILRPHLAFTRSDLHRRVTLSLSYHLQDFIMQLSSQLYNLIYLRLQNFISPRSRANRRLVSCCLLPFCFCFLNPFCLKFTEGHESGKLILLCVFRSDRCLVWKYLYTMKLWMFV